MRLIRHRMIRMVNLYAGIGGNRLHWSDYGEVTAVEYSLTIAEAYKEQYPEDKAIKKRYNKRYNILY